MAYSPVFGDWITQKRIEKQVSLRKMAEKLNYSAPFWSDVEKAVKMPPEISKLEEIARILDLTEEEKITMFNLAGEVRQTIAPDLPDYIRQRDYVAAALRTARDLNAGEKEWQKFVDDLKKRKG